MQTTVASARRWNTALCLVLPAAGTLHDRPDVWFAAFWRIVLVLFFGTVASSAAFQFVASKVGRLIQTSPSAQPTRVRDELIDTFVGFCWLVGAIVAWPVTQAQLGRETALRSSLAECGVNNSAALYVIKALFGLLVADAYNYWKHRCFHHRALWAFHKTHHSHHNPSCMAGYAISPMYSFATFWPVYLFCVPQLGLYAPLHTPFLFFYLFLNFYLHCGYVIDPVERIFAPLGIMTSAWHNVHHEKGRLGFDYKDQTFGEMLSLWDIAMGTYPQGHYKTTADRSGKAKGA